jgi:hypothetical protein
MLFVEDCECVWFLDATFTFPDYGGHCVFGGEPALATGHFVLIAQPCQQRSKNIVGFRRFCKIKQDVKSVLLWLKSRRFIPLADNSAPNYESCKLAKASSS